MNNELNPRDAKLNPKPGDRFLRWKQTVTVTDVNQGCVFTTPSLTTDPRGWIGTLHFRRWAAEAEVATAPRECAECKALLCNGHASDCSQHVAHTSERDLYGADGFRRTAAGRIDGFATGNVREPRVAAIGNGLFVRVGTGRKTTKTRRAA
jgi:hypothetical protein